MIEQLSFISQNVTVPLYALLIFTLLPGGYLADKAKELVERYTQDNAGNPNREE